MRYGAMSDPTNSVQNSPPSFLSIVINVLKPRVKIEANTAIKTDGGDVSYPKPASPLWPLVGVAILVVVFGIVAIVAILHSSGHQSGGANPSNQATVPTSTALPPTTTAAVAPPPVTYQAQPPAPLPPGYYPYPQVTPATPPPTQAYYPQPQPTTPVTVVVIAPAQPTTVASPTWPFKNPKSVGPSGITYE